MPSGFALDNCSVCHGTGWELRCVKGTSGARRCRCTALNRLLKLKELVRIPARYQHCSFDSYHPVTLSQARALADARRFAQRYPNVSGGLFFTGGAGVGKTHLAVAVIRDLLQRFHEDVLFIDCATVLFHPTHRFSDKRNESLESERVKRVSLLVLDNFGSMAPRPERLESVGECLHARWLAKRWTIYTGEEVPFRSWFRENRADHANFSRKDERRSLVFARMWVRLATEVKIVAIHGADYRQERADHRALF